VNTLCLHETGGRAGISAGAVPSRGQRVRRPPRSAWPFWDGVEAGKELESFGFAPGHDFFAFYLNVVDWCQFYVSVGSERGQSSEKQVGDSTSIAVQYAALDTGDRHGGQAQRRLWFPHSGIKFDILFPKFRAAVTGFKLEARAIRTRREWKILETWLSSPSTRQPSSPGWLWYSQLTNDGPSQRQSGTARARNVDAGVHG
jgi:hypothetical protein